MFKQKVISVILAAIMMLAIVPQAIFSSNATATNVKARLEFLTDAIYDGFGRYSEGLAYVRQGLQFGYLDKTGKMVIPARFPLSSLYVEFGQYNNDIEPERANFKGNYNNSPKCIDNA